MRLTIPRYSPVTGNKGRAAALSGRFILEKSMTKLRRAGESSSAVWIREMCGEPREWQPYVIGWSRKRHCDVKLHDGRQFGPCWPSAGFFHDLNDRGTEIPEADVAQIRYYNPKGFPNEPVTVS